MVKIKIEAAHGKWMWVTLDEAEKIWEELNVMFDKEEKVEYVPYPCYPYPLYDKTPYISYSYGDKCHCDG